MATHGQGIYRLKTNLRFGSLIKLIGVAGPFWSDDVGRGIWLQSSCRKENLYFLPPPFLSEYAKNLSTRIRLPGKYRWCIYLFVCL